MKPIRIISHTRCDEPGYLCEYLHRHDIKFENIGIEGDGTLPKGVDDISSLVILGSPYSVNDAHPWINDELALVKFAQQCDIPVLGICFGGQLISKALGGSVEPFTGMQIGWDTIRLTQAGKSVFANTGMADSFQAFEWHGDIFSIPPGGELLFQGECIKNQGFIYGKCLALQFHLDITETMIHEWMERYAQCFAAPSGCIQAQDRMFENINERLAAQRKAADNIFAWWLAHI